MHYQRQLVISGDNPQAKRKLPGDIRGDTGNRAAAIRWFPSDDECVDCARPRRSTTLNLEPRFCADRLLPSAFFPRTSCDLPIPPATEFAQSCAPGKSHRGQIFSTVSLGRPVFASDRKAVTRSPTTAYSPVVLFKAFPDAGTTTPFEQHSRGDCRCRRRRRYPPPAPGNDRTPPGRTRL